MRKTRRSFTFATIALGAAVAASAVVGGGACSSSTSSGGGATGDAAASDGGGGADGGGGQAVNGCTASSYEDHTAASDPRKITFPMTTPAQFAPPCMHVKVGQSVTWTGGDFSVHPLEANGGDTPTPINTITSGTAPVSIPFPTAGTFGFDCAEHPSIMHGAIYVSP